MTSVPHKTIVLQNHNVNVTWERCVEERLVNLVFQTSPFKVWEQNINAIENDNPLMPVLHVESIHIQSVDLFGTRIGFSKFKVVAKKWNEREHKIVAVAGITFMRGGAVGILPILKENTGKDGKEYVVVTVQPRVPAGIVDFVEIPAGMLDDDQHKFAGKAADEMREETLLQINENELIDLTQMAYGDRFLGMYPSAGGCDEFIRLFLYRRYMNPCVLEALREARAGDNDSEMIRIKLVPVNDLWREAPDSKALAALYLYERFIEQEGPHQPLPVDLELEKTLLSKLAAQRATSVIHFRPKKRDEKAVALGRLAPHWKTNS